MSAAVYVVRLCGIDRDWYVSKWGGWVDRQRQAARFASRAQVEVVAQKHRGRVVRLVKRGAPAHRDSIKDWLDAHPEEAAAHAGEYVAIDASRGIVAHGATLAEVHRQCDESGDRMRVGFLWLAEVSS